MKLAKKVLAVVMALGLIACMSAMAFATDAGSYGVYYAKSEDGKTLTATVYAYNYVGLTSGTIDLTYSGGAKFDHATMGAEAKAVNDTADNGFYADINNTGAGEVIYGFYFKEMMWDANTFAENGVDCEKLYIDVAAFDIVTFTFKLDGSAYEINVVITSKSFDGDNSKFVDTNTGAADTAHDVVPVVSEMPVVTPAADDKKCDDKKADDKAPACDDAAKTPAKTVKTDGGKNTGDNGVIAVMAGVIALAGAAFVVTKKRK